MKKIFVVADCFERFAKAGNVMLWHEFQQKLSTQDLDPTLEYWVGQGVTMADVNALSHDFPSVTTQLQGIRRLNKDHRIAHKYKPENAHLGMPEKISDTWFKIPVVIDKDCAEFNDHITGEHINGTILMEAVRQACIAVTESNFIKGQQAVYFILKEMTSTYNSFLFPLPITMDYTIKSHEIKGDFQTEFEIEASMYHNPSHPACLIKAVFSTYEKASMEQFESAMAAESHKLF